MAESMRQGQEALEEELLAPYALRSADARRRYRLENEGRAFDYRTCFQRDRDRVVYSRSFRRLRQKAQTGILPEYEDHRRNRLTHTLEVTQLARTIGRALRLNEDLVEAAALGHDLGQPPFGVSGERALDDLLSGRLDGRGGTGLGDLGGFRRAAQSLRVVDRLEKRYAHPGLNLTDPVREGILKSGPHRTDSVAPVEGLHLGLPPSLEAQVVIVADRIAATLHDLDDALQSGSVAVARVERLEAVQALRGKLGASYPARAGRFVKGNAIHRGLVHLLVTGTILHCRRGLERWMSGHGVTDPAELVRRREELLQGKEVTVHPKGRKLLDQIEGFLEAHVRRGHAADQVEARGRRVLCGLFAAYHADPTLLDDHVLLHVKRALGVRFLRDVPRSDLDAEVARYRDEAAFVQVLVDHLAAMTDPYAIAEHSRLAAMGAVPIPSAEQLRRERQP